MWASPTRFVVIQISHANDYLPVTPVTKTIEIWLTTDNYDITKYTTYINDNAY